MISDDQLRAQWLQLMQSLSAAASEDVFAELCRAYREPHRHYHTLEHITACLSHLSMAASEAERPEELALALWFHDAVYKPYSADNELQSATWAMTFMRGVGLQDDVVERVHDLIMATLHDGIEPITGDEKLMVDIDLAVLGADDDVFQHFEQDVRREYRWVPGFIYRRRRRALLAEFLSREHIYHLESFRVRYEEQARANLAQAVSKLS